MTLSHGYRVLGCMNEKSTAIVNDHIVDIPMRERAFFQSDRKYSA